MSGETRTYTLRHQSRIFMLDAELWAQRLIDLEIPILVGKIGVPVWTPLPLAK